MKKFCTFIFALFMVFGGNAAFAACTDDQIDAGTNGCQDVKFSLTTSSTSSFSFYLSAKGTFYVDCGNSGTLSGSGASGKTITKSNTTEYTYTCSWTTGAAQTIRFGGKATETTTTYNTSTSVAAINFFTDNANAKKITSISGNLSSMFPYITVNAQNGAQPRFYQTFYYAQNLTSIPDTLFADYTTPASYMFYSTFRYSGLTSIPAGLFSRITGAAIGLFYYTFLSCTNLRGYIPPSTFAGLIANGSPIASSMWAATFDSTALATTCPSGTTEFNTGYKSRWGGYVSCEIAPIIVRWGDKDGNLFESTSCTYGGALTTPTTAPTAPRGYHFVGWTFN